MRGKMAPWSAGFALWWVACGALAQAAETGGGDSAVSESAEVAESADGAASTSTTEGGELSPDGLEAEPAAEAVDAGTHAVRLRDLEQRVNTLKEQVFRSKARLSLLADTVLRGIVGGARVHIVHDSRLGASYKLVKVLYLLDGIPIMSRTDERGSGLAGVMDVYNGAMTPGDHTLSVELEYRGDGHRVFSYVDGYRFRVRSSYLFSAPEGGAMTVRAVAFEKGGPTAPIEERPAIAFLAGDNAEEAEDNAEEAEDKEAKVRASAKSSGPLEGELKLEAGQ